VKVRVAKVAAWSWVVGAVKMSRRVSPTKSWTSSKRKGEVSEGASEYSPGRRRKKKAKIIMSATAQKVGSAPGSPAR
jgi:hypothetical protein